jgi:hypothetical protein
VGVITLLSLTAHAAPHSPTVLPDVLADHDPSPRLERARISGAARWRLLDSEAWEDAGVPAFPTELVVLDVRPDALRVLVEDGGLRTAVWVERSGFSEHIIRETALAEGITALPGAPITRLHAPNGKPRVQVTEGGLTVTAMVSADDLGQVYRPDPIDREFVSVLATPEIYSADGTLITTLELEQWGSWVEDVGPSVDGRVSVAVRTDHLRVEGFVPADSISQTLGGLLGSLHSRGTPSGTHSVPIHLIAGTPLYRDGQIVGVTTAATQLLADPAQEPPDITVTVWLPWGMTTFQVRCPQLASLDRGWVCDPVKP